MEGREGWRGDCTFMALGGGGSLKLVEGRGVSLWLDSGETLHMYSIPLLSLFFKNIMILFSSLSNIK